MINWLYNYWAVLILLIVVVAEFIITIIGFSHKPTSEKIFKFKEWLLFAVSQAEKELGGGGTGPLKLRWVYDKALEQFPALTIALSFDEFCKYVDEALDKFRELLSSNEQVQKYVGAAEAK